MQGTSIHDRFLGVLLQIFQSPASAPITGRELHKIEEGVKELVIKGIKDQKLHGIMPNDVSWKTLCIIFKFLCESLVVRHCDQALTISRPRTALPVVCTTRLTAF